MKRRKKTSIMRRSNTFSFFTVVLLLIKIRSCLREHNELRHKIMTFRNVPPFKETRYFNWTRITFTHLQQSEALQIHFLMSTNHIVNEIGHCKSSYLVTRERRIAILLLSSEEDTFWPNGQKVSHGQIRTGMLKEFRRCGRGLKYHFFVNRAQITYKTMMNIWAEIAH